MKILTDLGHPKNVHVIKNLVPRLNELGHEVDVVYRDREHIADLCRAYGLKGSSRGRGGDGRLGKLFYLMRADLRLLRLAARLKPDLLLSFASPYLAHVARIRGIPMIVFDDTEDNLIVQRIYLKSASRIVVPACFAREMGPRQRRFPGYFELAYVHPTRFSPDPVIRKELELPGEKKIVLLRTVAWKAVHDLKHRGFGKDDLRLLVRELSKLARVVISAEGRLPPDLEPLRLRLPPERIHHVMAEASLVFSEGATMAAEAAVLGVPTVHCSDLRPGYIIDLEKRHGLLRSFDHRDLRSALDAGLAFLEAGEDVKGDLRRQKERMLAESGDVVEEMVKEIEEVVSSQ